jgi:adenylate kinase
LSGRRECPCCGALYNTASQPPRQPGICDVDGCSLVVREDDTEPVIRERLEAYEKQMGSLLEFYRERGRRVCEIDAGQLTREALFDRVCRSIGNE